MGREVTVGILVSAKDAASAVLAKVGGGAKAVGSAVGELASKGKESFKGFEEGIRTADHAMRLAHEGVRLFQETIGASIEKSIEWRGAQDASVKSLHEFSNVLGTTKSRIGDQFMPLLMGITTVMTPMLKQFQDWIRANSALISGGIIEWAVKLSLALVQGIAFGVLQIARAWVGWQLIVTSVQAVIDKAFSSVLESISDTLKLMSSLAEFAGKDDLAKSLRDAAEGAALMGKAYEQGGDEAMAAIYAEIRGLDDKEKAIARIRDLLVNGINGIGVAAMKNLASATNNAKMSAEELAALEDRWLQKYASRAATAAAYDAAVEAVETAEYNREMGIEAKKMAEILERNDGTIEGLKRMWQAYETFKGSLGQASMQQINRAMDAAVKAQNEKLKAEIHSVFSEISAGVYSTIMMNMTALAQGTIKAGEAIKGILLDIGRLILETTAKFLIAKGVEKAADKAAALFGITTKAADAAAGAAASQSSVPVIGPILAVGAMAAMFALVMGLTQKFHSGGMIPGAPGQERLIVGQAGEVVVPAQVVKAIANGQPVNAGGSVVSRGGGGGLTVVVQQQNLIPQDKVWTDRNLQDSVLPAIKRWFRNGQLRMSDLG